MADEELRFGIDIGGTGVKGAIVDVTTGELTTERFRIPTPHPATPHSVIPVVVEIIRKTTYQGPVGCAFPAVIKNGVAESAANIDHSWIGASVQAAVSGKLDNAPVTVLNDADAAGVAEMRFGAGKGIDGVVLMLTIGTGIGSALFLNGQLVPNTELGHVEVDGHDAETRVSEMAREKHDMSRKDWAKRFNRYLEVIDGLFSPDLVIIGGGISKDPDKFLPLLESKVTVVAATLANNAGIVGAALATE
jgi:polyphosphate glucokinase